MRVMIAAAMAAGLPGSATAQEEWQAASSTLQMHCATALDILDERISVLPGERATLNGFLIGLADHVRMKDAGGGTVGWDESRALFLDRVRDACAEDGRDIQALALAEARRAERE